MDKIESFAIAAAGWLGYNMSRIKTILKWSMVFVICYQLYIFINPQFAFTKTESRISISLVIPDLKL